MNFFSKSGFVCLWFRFTLELGKSKSGKTFFVRFGFGKNTSTKRFGSL